MAGTVRFDGDAKEKAFDSLACRFTVVGCKFSQALRYPVRAGPDESPDGHRHGRVSAPPRLLVHTSRLETSYPRLSSTRYPSTGWYYSVGVGWHAMGLCFLNG
jgi:hypothetical protein